MGRKPLIGISAYARAGTPLSFSLPVGYVDAVRAAGAVPVLLPPGEEEPEPLLDEIDGLILAGGGDIDPAAYGGAAHETVYDVSEERDRFEFRLARAALAHADRPMLLICRGLQILNVVRGGSLHVHLPDRFGSTIEHRLPPRLPASHVVHLRHDSRLGRMIGADRIQACSWHHQAIDRVGEGLRPVAWADDGVIEALEYEGHPWCFAVQWHPEMQLSEEHSERLFAGFIGAVGQNRR
jgi:putative glutamine amidotransferase